MSSDSIAWLLRLLLAGARDLLLPEGCFLCSGLLVRGGRPLSGHLCPTCGATVHLLDGSACTLCGERSPSPAGGAKPLQRRSRCRRCRDRVLGFDRCAAGALYRGAVKDLVLRLKFSRDLKAAVPLGRLAAMGAERALGGLRPFAVTAVPLHPLKRLRRGFNQAELIARNVAREMGAAYMNGLVRRIRYTPSQGAGGGRDRLRNMHGAFVPTRRLRRLAASGRPDRLLLVDDVVSTAATLDHCARAFREGGIPSVICAAAAT